MVEPLALLHRGQHLAQVVKLRRPVVHLRTAGPHDLEGRRRAVLLDALVWPRQTQPRVRIGQRALEVALEHGDQIWVLFDGDELLQHGQVGLRLAIEDLGQDVEVRNELVRLLAQRQAESIGPTDPHRLGASREGGDLCLRHQAAHDLAEVAHAEAPKVLASWDAEAIGAAPVVEGRSCQRVEVARVGRTDRDALTEPAIHLALVEQLKPHPVGESPGALTCVADEQDSSGGLVSELDGLSRERVQRSCPAHGGSPHDPLDEECLSAVDGRRGHRVVVVVDVLLLQGRTQVNDAVEPVETRPCGYGGFARHPVMLDRVRDISWAVRREA